LAARRFAVFLDRVARIFPTPVTLFAMVLVIGVTIKILVDGESIADKCSMINP
jgi:hypothetical protein